MRFIPIAMIAVTSLSAADLNGFAGLSYGKKSLNESDWKPAADHIAMGIQAGLISSDFPVGGYLSYRVSEGDSNVFVSGQTRKFTAETNELHLGPMVYLRSEYIAFYGTVGIALIKGNAEVGGVGSTDDTAPGIYFAAGASALLAGHWGLGAELSLSSAVLDLSGVEVDGGGATLALIAGYHL